MKKIILSIFVIFLLGITSVYFFMPGTMFGFLRKIERKAAGLQEQNIVVNGLTIHYLEGGKGDPLVFIHGRGYIRTICSFISK
ncbi:MAG: hypothetical protein GY707_18540 [Desulfobacteraceae bacterium]|nr:hypothetical protein [Desulfobacteraceae bacterium]